MFTTPICGIWLCICIWLCASSQPSNLFLMLIMSLFYPISLSLVLVLNPVTFSWCCILMWCRTWRHFCFSCVVIGFFSCQRSAWSGDPLYSRSPLFLGLAIIINFYFGFFWLSSWTSTDLDWFCFVRCFMDYIGLGINVDIFRLLWDYIIPSCYMSEINLLQVVLCLVYPRNMGGLQSSGYLRYPSQPGPNLGLDTKSN